MNKIMQAHRFERYLKIGSGQGFRNKRLVNDKYI